MEGRSAKGGHDKMFADDLARKIAMMNEGMNLLAASIKTREIRKYFNEFLKYNHIDPTYV